jgi:DNA/RNA-binding domain of Phe-tRNA-synthetase-like protein
MKNKVFNNYKNLAVEKFNNLNSDLIANEEISVDDDALVAASKSGAYVHCWVWVDNTTKPKRTRKKTV